MKESGFQTKFTKWLKYGTDTPTGAFELKLAKGPSMPFNAVLSHQIAALQIAKHSRLAYKIADDSQGSKPFDCFLLQKTGAWVVIQFWERGEKEFFMIDVDDFVKEMEQSDRKSLTPERAKEIGKAYFLG